MAYGQIDYKNQQWVADLGKYLNTMKEEYYQVGRTCHCSVSNPMLIGEVAERMDVRDGNMLIQFFDPLTNCIHDNMHMLSHTEIGSYISSEDGFIEDDDCYNLLARTVLGAADTELGYGTPKSVLIQWMNYMFLSPSR